MYSRKCNRECFSLPLSFSLSTHVRRIKLGHRAKEKLLLRMGLARPPRKGRRRSESSRRRAGRLRTGRNEGSSCTYFDTFPAAVALVGFRFKELRDVGGCYTPRRITSAFRFLSLHRTLSEHFKTAVSTCIVLRMRRDCDSPDSTFCDGSLQMSDSGRLLKS